jgi:ribosomal protein S27AE
MIRKCPNCGYRHGVDLTVPNKRTGGIKTKCIKGKFGGWWFEASGDVMKLHDGNMYTKGSRHLLGCPKCSVVFMASVES